MGKLILVTGGARSGKSSFAEELAKTCGNKVLYIATSMVCDDEMRLRVQKHKERRPHEWETLEAYKDFDVCLVGRLSGKEAVLLDCITIMVSNIMLETGIDWDRLKMEDMDEVELLVKRQVEKLIDVAGKSEAPFILVTNEVGMGIVPENTLSRMFRDIAGRMNQLLAGSADEVYFCVSGIPIRIK